MFGYDASKTKYTSSGMVVKLQIKSRGKITETGIRLAIDSETGAISAKDWENRLGLHMPFEIRSCDVIIDKLDGKDTQMEYHLNNELNEDKFDDINCELEKTENNTICGLHIEMENEHSIEVEISVELKLNRKDLRPLFIVEKNEGER